MNSIENNHALSVLGESFAVTDEVYTTYRSVVHHMRYIATKEGRCSQSNFKSCPGDCSGCMWSRDTVTVSYEALYADGLEDIASDVDIEAELIEKESIAEIYAFADRVVEFGAAILKMTVLDQMTDSEIANHLGVSRKAVKYRRQKMLSEFQQNYQRQ